VDNLNSSTDFVCRFSSGFCDNRIALVNRFPVVGVVSGCGGAGASVFSAVLAGVAALWGVAFLVDCDPLGGGIDVLLGCEQTAGARWKQVQVRGGELDPELLRDGLPTWGGVSFLAADSPIPLDPLAVGSVMSAAAKVGPVVLDLPRWSTDARLPALEACDLVVLVTPAEVRAVTSSSVVLAGLAADGVPLPRVAVAVRGTSRVLAPSRISSLLDIPVLGVLPHDSASSRPAGMQFGQVRRATRAVADSAWAHVSMPRPTAAA
jgi:secretion/DNA translocation related CpaE-like protein